MRGLWVCQVLRVVGRTDQLPDGEERQLVRQYTLHPATAEFVVSRHGDAAALRLGAHRRIGAWLEAEAVRSPYIETDLEAGDHWFAAGEYDRSHALLGPSSEWLTQHGHVREGLRVLEPLLAEPVRRAMAPARISQALGSVGSAYYTLGQVEEAIGYYEQCLVGWSASRSPKESYLYAPK